MKILAFAASNSRNSINNQLIHAAASLLEAGLVPDVEVEVIDLNEYEMPLYGIDRQDEIGVPDLAHKFSSKIAEADALIISFAEHNGSYTVAYKNLFDWTSRIDRNVFQNKPSVFLSTSPGARGGAGALSAAVGSAPHYGADLRGHLSIPSFFANFDPSTQSITDPELAAQFSSTLATLAPVTS